MLNIPWTADMNNLNVFKKAKTQRHLSERSEKDSPRVWLLSGEKNRNILWQLENLWKETEQENILDSIFCSWHRIVLASTN